MPVRACPSAASWLLAMIALTVPSWFAPAVAAAGAPTEAMKQTSEQVVHILNDEALRQPDQVSTRRQQLVMAVGRRFSYEEMSKRALGEHWTKLSEEQKQEFVGLFQTLLATSYVGKIERYAGEQVQYLGERVSNGYAEVQAKLMSAKNEFLLDFRLVERAGDWLVFDVIVDGVSLVGSYRRQLARVMRLVPYADVLASMREKANVAMEVRAR